MRSLEELYLRCRNNSSKEHILEAINCYKAGAYRSCIITTWIALVYDFVEKVNELALTGDKEAINIKNDIERNRINHNIQHFLAFEKSALQTMRQKFELLSPIEYKMLERLNEDRNLCAHPSMIGEVIPFEATAELARYHLTNVIDFVLSKPPVQGKAALDNIFKKLDSDYFPIEQNEIKTVLLEGPLGRAKESLNSQFFKRVFYTYISSEGSSLTREKYQNTLVVFWELNEDIVEIEFSKYTQNIFDDNKKDTFFNICNLLANIPTLYPSLSELNKSKIKNYVLQDAPVYLLSLLNSVNDLGAVIKQRIDYLGDVELFEFILKYPNTSYKLDNLRYSIDKVIERFGKSGGYRESEARFKNILNLGHILTENNINEIIDASLKNDQISKAFLLGELYIQLFEELDKSMIGKISYEKLKCFDFYEKVIEVIQRKSEE